MKELIDLQRSERNKFEASLHGAELADGGPVGSGMVQSPGPQDDPTQGKGTPAWQEAQRMSLEINAKRRRN